MKGMESLDAIVIGAGPAGSIAALRLAESGRSVLLAEKRETVGSPVRCAEATGPREEIARFVPLKEEWIASDIDGARFVSPRGTRIEKSFPRIGVVLDRERFDAGLAAAAVAAGAVLRTGCEAVRIERSDRDRWIVGFEEEGGARECTAPLLVGADGVESVVGRRAGIDSGWSSTELFSCLEVRLRGARCDGTIEFHFGAGVAPGGYAWVFPRGDDLWNVGVGIDPSRAERVPAKIFLDRFVERHFAGSEILGSMAGAACRSRALRTISGEGILLVGDAAHQGNPLTGGGIMNALEGADLAGRIGAAAFTEGDLSAKRLARYDREWRRTVGKVNDRYHRLANLLFRKYDDDDMEEIWHATARLLRNRKEKTGFFPFIRDYLAFPADFVAASLPVVPGLSNRRILF